MKLRFSFLFTLSISFLIFSESDSAAQIPSGASFWLKADSGVIFSQNNVVAEWKDRSGTTKSAFQSLPVSQPTLVSGAINNLPVVHFDGRFDYLDCAPVFPVAKDYSIAIVARVIDFSRMNHFLSGNTHAIYVRTDGYPILQNDTAPAPAAVSKIALVPSKPTIFTFTYEQDLRIAKIYVNGELADSATISPNKDPKIYLGAFQGVASFFGDLAEIVIYQRALPETDRKRLEDYLFTKYAIPPAPAPDSIYTEVPKHLQFYPRDADDSATVRIAGHYLIPGFDSLYVRTYKNGIFIGRVAQSLRYESGKAAFELLPRIHAELAEYSFVLGVKSQTVDKQIGFRDSIVCGDVLLICGQSNSIDNNLGYTNEFFRTFGSNQASSLADTAWAVSSTAINFGPGPVSGSWGIRLQENIMNTYKIPVCVINGGVGGTAIGLHLPDTLYRLNIGTIYGNMLYRAVKSGLAGKAKVLFWYQGESDVLQGYFEKFRSLYTAWKQDYPNVKKIYVMQVRPGCTLGFGADVRDLLRTLQDSFPNIESVSTMGLPGHDGCHFLPEGYVQLGDQLFKLLARDFYGSTDNSQISSPNIVQAYYTNSQRSRIGLTFAPIDTRFILPNDTVIGGIPASLKDYFYLSDTGEVVESMSTSGNKVFLNLHAASAAKVISYLPDKYYNHTSAIYEGPWLENERGVGAFSFYHVPIVDSAKAALPAIDRSSDMVMSAFPNPTHGKFMIQYELPNDGYVTIRLCDLLGKEYASISKGLMAAGKYSEMFDMKDIPAARGIYFCKLKIGTKISMVMISYD